MSDQIDQRKADLIWRNNVLYKKGYLVLDIYSRLRAHGFFPLARIANVDDVVSLLTFLPYFLLTIMMF